MIPIPGEQKRRICYFFDSDIGNYHYGPAHPMKPHRIRMAHALVMNYGLYKKMEIFRAKPATRKEMAQFHTDDYVEFLSKVTPENMDGFLKEQAKFNLGDDCPVFDGLFEYCSISAGGSMEGAARLSRDKCDIAVNWAGGLHHAKKSEANGFCYVNDIVLGILELLRYHKRVLYVDIDVHHGDGVEEAFYSTDRVMTCSFHKYGEFFPGTGELRDTGHGKGKYYAVNFPLRDGITDDAYKNIFEPVVTKIMETYQPSAIVLQCGGDSLSGDRLGSFNMSMRGHANCVQFIKALGLPLLLVGGGGYTIRNVARAWAFETGLAAGQELSPEIPMNEYYEYYGPTYRLEVPPSNMEDMNVQQYLDKIKVQIFENLRHTIPAPSVGLQAIPRLSHDDMDVDEDLDDPNERRPQRLLDDLVQRDDEFSDSEDEGEGGRRNVQSHKRIRTQLGQSSKRNGHALSPIHNGLNLASAQFQFINNSAIDRLAQSRQSSLTSSATTSLTNGHIPPHTEDLGRKLTGSPQSRHMSLSQHEVRDPTPSAQSLSETAAPASLDDQLDIPMLSEAEQIELENLAAGTLDSAPTPTIQTSSGPTTKDVTSLSHMNTDEDKLKTIHPNLSSQQTAASLVQHEALKNPNDSMNSSSTLLESERNLDKPTSSDSNLPALPTSQKSNALTSLSKADVGQQVHPPILGTFPEKIKTEETDPKVAVASELKAHESIMLPAPQEKQVNGLNNPISSLQPASLKPAESNITPGEGSSRVQLSPTPKTIKSKTSNPQHHKSRATEMDVSLPSSIAPISSSQLSPCLATSLTGPGKAELCQSIEESIPKLAPFHVDPSTTAFQSCSLQPLSSETAPEPNAHPMRFEGMTEELANEVEQAISEGEATCQMASNAYRVDDFLATQKQEPLVSSSTMTIMDPQLNSSTIFPSSSSSVLSTTTTSTPINHPTAICNISKTSEECRPKTPAEASSNNDRPSIQTNECDFQFHHYHSSIDPLITGSSSSTTQTQSLNLKKKS
ncbi:hypothetical protein O181_001810 [Austropuccinia psidii MF-1]|uniref:histone deacetylase n=1 Tax=Austropuccinia psidii MF-1 TaxID=1389203 RepID=A0A9Q3BB92_9BASI|nr:hypothetical protein [Austropuccinia psidii MF-1]